MTFAQNQSGPVRRPAAATVLVDAGRPPRTQGAPLNPAIVLTSTYFSRGVPGPGEMVYTRDDTESWQAPEQIIGQLEGAGRPACLFGSGMAAIAAAFSLAPVGGRIVLPTCSYQVGQHFADDLVRRGLASVERVKIDDTEAVIQALDAAPTAMLWLESPTNPMMEVADLPALIGAARARGIVTVVDNTFATPLVQRPLEFGADVVVHSVTKYFAGHSDLVMGAVACASAEFDALVREYRTLHGAIPGPVEAWLALRGMRTMALRVERSQANALELARRLEADPRVAWVRHPGLEKDPGHARAAAQMDGFGSIVTFEPTAGPGGAPDAGGAAGGAVAGGGAPAADAVVAAVRLWTPATSLGGVESTLERRRRFDGESAEVPEGLIRLSVGIEDVEDLWADLDQALAAAA